MKPTILNFGSCNIDHVYTVDEFVNPGETLSAKTYQTFPGGKGLNQSVAISEAGGSCAHVGHVPVTVDRRLHDAWPKIDIFALK